MTFKANVKLDCLKYRDVVLSPVVKWNLLKLNSFEIILMEAVLLLLDLMETCI